MLHFVYCSFCLRSLCNAVFCQFSPFPLASILPLISPPPVSHPTPKSMHHEQQDQQHTMPLSSATSVCLILLLACLWSGLEGSTQGNGPASFSASNTPPARHVVPSSSTSGLPKSSTQRSDRFWLPCLLRLASCMRFLFQTVELLKHASIALGFQVAFCDTPFEEQALRILIRDLPALLVMSFVSLIKTIDLLNLLICIFTNIYKSNKHQAPHMLYGWRSHLCLLGLAGYGGKVASLALPFRRVLAEDSVFALALPTLLTSFGLIGSKNRQRGGGGLSAEK